MRGRQKVEEPRFYQHRDLYDKCQACRNCIDKNFLLTPFEKGRLPLPWQGTLGPRVKVLFLWAKPSYTKFSPRLSDYSDAHDLRTMLDSQYETHAIAFKRRRSLDGSIRAHARRVASLLLETPEPTISDFDDYLFTSLVRCSTEREQPFESLDLLADECLDSHGAALFGRLPNLQWIVLVGSSAHRLLSLSEIWAKFRRVVQVNANARPVELPSLREGVSDVVCLNEHLRLIAVPKFCEGAFRPEHYRRIFASWMTHPPLAGSGARGSMRGAPRAARKSS
jgi:hypothetical protein